MHKVLYKHYVNKRANLKRDYSSDLSLTRCTNSVELSKSCSSCIRTITVSQIRGHLGSSSVMYNELAETTRDMLLINSALFAIKLEFLLIPVRSVSSLVCDNISNGACNMGNTVKPKSTSS